MRSRVRTNKSGTLCPRDAASKGRIIQRTHFRGERRPRDAMSKGRYVQGTPYPRDAMSKGRTVQGTKHQRPYVWGHIGPGHFITPSA